MEGLERFHICEIAGDTVQDMVLQGKLLSSPIFFTTSLQSPHNNFSISLGLLLRQARLGKDVAEKVGFHIFEHA